MKKSLLFILTLVLSLSLMAQQRSLSNAKDVAKSFLKSEDVQVVDNDYSKARATLNVNVRRSLSKARAENAPFYVFNDVESQTYVIVSGDERQNKILAYGDGIFDVEKAPDALLGMLAQYADEYEYVKGSPILRPHKAKARRKPDTPVAPLITTSWGQGFPYNKYTPTVGIYRSPSGCVATAMAQIMNYHQYPSVGQGSFSYTTATRKISQSIDFAEKPIEWSKMLDDYSADFTTEEGSAVGNLMQLCGISVGMDYDYNGSGSYTADVPYALIHTFKYNPNIEYLLKDYFDEDDWRDIINEELENGRPIEYSGSGSAGGHAFVLDGADGNGLYHFNWGWDGELDGYFSLSSLTPSYDFSSGQGMVCHITPEKIGEHHDVFFAESFTHDDETVKFGSSTYFNLYRVYNYSNTTSYVYGNKTEFTIGLGIYDADFNYIKTVSSFSTELMTFYGYSAKFFSFKPLASDFPEGQMFYIAPVVRSNASSIPTMIRTQWGENGYYSAVAYDGELHIGAYIPQQFTIDGIMYKIANKANCVSVAMAECEGDVVIPEQVQYGGITYKVTEISSRVFEDNTKIKSISLPATIEHIGYWAFKGCTSLKKVTCNAAIPPKCDYQESYPFDEVVSAKLYVPQGTRVEYRQSDGWNVFKSIMIIGVPELTRTNVTSKYVVNPNFNSDNSGWQTTTGSAVNWLANNQTDGYYATGTFWENWNPTEFFGKMYQEITLEDGIYELQMAAFTSNKSGAYVYANSSMIEIDSDQFDKFYNVTTLVTDNHLEIGILMPSAVHQWVGMDNVKLYYYGKVNDNYMSELLAKQIDDSNTILWQSGMLKVIRDNLKTNIDEANDALMTDDVETMLDAYKNLVEAHQMAQESANFYVDLGIALDKLNSMIVPSKAPQNVKDEAYDLHKEVFEKYAVGEYPQNKVTEKIDEIIVMCHKLSVPDVTGASDESPVDMTSAIWGHDMPDSKDWEVWRYGGSALVRTDLTVLEFYDCSTFSCYQEINWLPNGIYRITMQGFYRPGSVADAQLAYRNDSRTNMHAYLFGDNGEVTLGTYIQPISQGAGKTRLNNADATLATGLYIPDNMDGASAYFRAGRYADNELYVEVKNNKLILGVTKQVAKQYDWMIFDGFNLYYYGEESSHWAGECSGKYKLTWKVGTTTMTQMLCPGQQIVEPEDFEAEDGYEVKWNSHVSQMPEKDLTITGTYVVADAIKSIGVDSEKLNVYNLQGIKMNNSSIRKGVYIVNSKKFVR